MEKIELVTIAGKIITKLDNDIYQGNLVENCGFKYFLNPKTKKWNVEEISNHKTKIEFVNGFETIEDALNTCENIFI